MLLYKVMAVALLLLTPIFAFILVRLSGLERRGLKFTDLAFPLYALQLLLISRYFFTYNILPYYLIILALLALVITINLLNQTRLFTYRRFFKLFWRIGFILTFLLDLALVVSLFFLP